MGDNAYILGRVTIGKDVMMAANCAFIASNHNTERTDIQMFSDDVPVEKCVKLADSIDIYIKEQAIKYLYAENKYGNYAWWSSRWCHLLFRIF